MLTCQKVSVLLSGYLDGELTQGDRQRVELHLESCDSCRRGYQELSRLKQTVADLPFEELSQQQWSSMMKNLSVRGGFGVGWLSFIAGFVIVMGYSAYEMARGIMADEAMPALVKSGVAALIFGLIALFGAVLRQRMIERKSDPYKDVQI